MAKLALGLSTVAVLAVIALLWVQRNQRPAPPDAPMPVVADEPTDPQPESVLSAIEKLESEKDAKCHSSATRFEDLLYATPLADEGHWANIDHQKRWVRRIWADASEAASRAGESAISPRRIREQIEEWLDWSEVAEGQLEVRSSDHPPLRISKLRADQYASIAYSLRAILSVQQDRVLAGDSWLSLAPGAIGILRESTDIATLGALMIADQRARERNEFEITDTTLRSAWNSLLPDLEDSSRSDEEPSLAVDRASRARLLAMLEEMIANKIEAHREYNAFGDDAEMLFRSNVARFYARIPVPQNSQAWSEFISMFNGRLNEFAMDLLLEASAHADAAGHEFIRASDASLAVQRLIPREIGDFADVTMFPRLASEEQIVLEAYDCDSFRDFGLHWPPLDRAIRVLPKDAKLPDPFAAEIIAEAISQYGVLLFRVAGELARQTIDNVRLHSKSIALSTAVIDDRIERNRKAPEMPEFSNEIALAEGDDAVEPSDLFFSDVTATSGVDFTHRSSNWLHELRRRNTKTPPTFSGGGVAAEDIDGDGDMDLLFVGGGGNALYLNDGTGRFHDITDQTGIDFVGPDGSYREARNPIIADFDNDGLQDILITYANDDHRLYRNTGGSRFEDVSEGSGLLGEGVLAGPATAFDFDGDGLLDLYIGHLGDYLNGVLPTPDRDTRNGGPNKLFRNLGGMRFADVTAGSGSAGAGWTQAVSHTDFDRDGRQDIIVANDFGRNAFLRNLGDGKFENVAPALGVMNAYHSMNVGISEMNDDGHPDIYISNMASLMKDDKFIFPDVNAPINLELRSMSGIAIKESDVLYLSRLDGGRLIAYEPSQNIERGATSTGWAWDAEFFDFDCDGDEDLYLVNGTNDYHAYAAIYNYVNENGRREQYLLNHTREANVFFLNGGGKLENESARSGVDAEVNSRSTAYLDFEGDGDLDIAVNNFHAPALMFRNNAEERDIRWLKIRLIGDPSRGSNRDAIGSRIVATTDAGLRMTREIQGGSGYLSMNPKQQHFGLGRSNSADVHILWPNGEEQTIEGLAANRIYTVRQSENAPGNSLVEHPANSGR